MIVFGNHYAYIKQTRKEKNRVKKVGRERDWERRREGEKNREGERKINRKFFTWNKLHMETEVLKID